MEPAFENQDEFEESRERRANLYKAAAKGDWGKAEEIFKKYPDCVRDKLSNVGNTSLHLALIAGQIDFAERLAVSKYMTEDVLEQENYERNTAFSLAAMSGNTRLARLMLKKNPELAMIRNGNWDLPIQMAASLGHEKMVNYLYQSTKDKELRNGDLIKLLITLIKRDLYDVAVMMVEDENKKEGENKKGGLTILRATPKKEEEEGETALHALARMPLRSNAKQGGLLSWSIRKNKKMHPKALKLLKILWKTIAKLDYDEITKLIAKPWSLLHVAAENGNIEFLSVLIETHPDLICELDENGYNIFHSAVEYRHESILELVYKTPSIKSVIVAGKVGKKKNNILHLAAKLPPQNRLNIVSGATLQMQRELWWFEEVRQLMPPDFDEDENEDGKTASALFTESHKNLMEEGEKWMKKTAESCMIVATLITTIIFTAALTPPGGIRTDTGAANLVKSVSFNFFAVSNMLSLVSSAYSILAFLSIITARYAEEDFLWSLHLKLFSGLYTLFISIIGMMIVFCTTFFIVFGGGPIGLCILLVLLAFIPIVKFIFHQSGLLVNGIKLMRLSKKRQSKEEERKGRKPLKEDV